jgi:hypothetical protein
MAACMAVRNHESQYTQLRGMHFAPMSLYGEAFQTPISFSSDAEGPAPAFYHIHMPALGPVVSLLVGRQFVVNSPEHFLLFVPKPSTELTYKQAFFPTDETHTLVVPKQVGKAHTVSLGAVLVGLNVPRLGGEPFKPQDFSTVVCFYREEKTTFNLMHLNRVGFFVIQHMRRILPGLVAQLRSGVVSPAFKATMSFGPTENISRVMLPLSPPPAAKRPREPEPSAPAP